MSKTKLKWTIENGRDKLCPACNATVRVSNFNLEGGKFKGREFWCPACKAAYSYKKNDKKFLLQKAKYILPEYNVEAIYRSTIDNIPFFSFVILPCKRGSAYTQFFYEKRVVVNKKLEFPLTLDELEDKISLYITFL